MSIIELRIRIESICEMLDVPEYLIPLYSSYEEADDGIFIELEAEKINIIRAEPFGQFVHFSSSSQDEILFALFKVITFEMASRLTSKDCGPDIEVRRLLWPKQLELLNRVSPSWKESLKMEIMQTLKKYPVKDGRGEIELP